MVAAWRRVTYFIRRTARAPPTAGKLARIVTRCGMGDFQIFHTDGRVMLLEVKRKGGKLSPGQQRIADHMRRAGHAFEVVDSVEAAIAVRGAGDDGAVGAPMARFRTCAWRCKPPSFVGLQ